MTSRPDVIQATDYAGDLLLASAALLFDILCILRGNRDVTYL